MRCHTVDGGVVPFLSPHAVPLIVTLASHYTVSLNSLALWSTVETRVSWPGIELRSLGVAVRRANHYNYTIACAHCPLHHRHCPKARLDIDFYELIDLYWTTTPCQYHSTNRLVNILGLLLVNIKLDLETRVEFQLNQTETEIVPEFLSRLEI